MTKYKTEKRKAEVGERILITNADYELSDYQNGGVFMVTNSGTTGAVLDCGMISQHHEYEVIVGEHTPAPNLFEMDYDELIALVEDAMKALRTRSYKNGYDQGRFDAEIEATHGTYEKSDQQKRDEIVEQAKVEIEQMEKNVGEKLGYSKCHVEFVVNSKKRTVVALVFESYPSGLRRKGIAKCAPNDCFNAHIGKDIALRRALGLEVPSEYLNVPQPTEIRVGDVVRGVYTGGKTTYERKIAKIEGGRYMYDSGGFDYIEDDDLVIIDDSRAGEGE
ncbi:hypothetical protein IHP72_15270 [Bacillus pumilus]|uniref:hypothetical protein n=1 Tax=Bacillus pumilus TaxID=1408 RepID=UPI001B39E894|nr:hypothetical protein [Bacillus pumilus]MBQ4817614.1 hypothetical protein [Bacillus pumilus]